MNTLKAEDSYKTRDETPTHQELYRSLNLEILNVCRDLPRSLQIPAALQLMAGARRPDAGPAGDFCAEFPATLWAILAPPSHAAVSNADSAPTPGSNGEAVLAPFAADLQIAVRTQAMAFLLHIIDDHLSDGQGRTNVLLLQLRTAVWNRFQRGVDALDPGVVSFSAGARDGDTMTALDGTAARVRAWIDLYFETVYEPPAPENLDEFMELATGQMAIWSVAPALLALRRRGAVAGPAAEHFSDAAADANANANADQGPGFAECEAIRGILDAVVLAWRLTDDLEDWQDDARDGFRSALYYLAPADVRSVWDAAAHNAARLPELKSILERAGIPGRARSLARNYLSVAANTAHSAGRPDLREIINAAAKRLQINEAPQP